MHVLIAGRQEGKTTKLMEWVKGGVRIDPYPGWSRVAIVANWQRHDVLREKYWAELEDFDHRVYKFDEFKYGRFPSTETKYRIDDLDAFLSMLFPYTQIHNIDGFTITAENWDDEEKFKGETIDEIDYFKDMGLLFPIGIRTRSDAEAYLEHLDENEHNEDLLEAMKDASNNEDEDKS